MQVLTITPSPHRYRQAFPSTRRVILAQNYRSTSTLVFASAALVGHNLGRTPKNAWTHQPAGEPIVIAECRTVANECRYVCEGIRQMLRSGRQPRDIAILFRTARVGMVMQQALCTAALPFNSHAANLWESRSVRELRALLEVLVAPADDDAFESAVVALVPTHAAELLGFLHQRRPGSRRLGGKGARGARGGRSGKGGRGGLGGGRGRQASPGGGGVDADGGGERCGERWLSLRAVAEQLRAEHQDDPPRRPKRPKLDEADQLTKHDQAANAENMDRAGKGALGVSSGAKGGGGVGGGAKGGGGVGGGSGGSGCSGEGGGGEGGVGVFNGAHYDALCKCLGTLITTLERRIGILLASAHHRALSPQVPSRRSSAVSVSCSYGGCSTVASRRCRPRARSTRRRARAWARHCSTSARRHARRLPSCRRRCRPLSAALSLHSAFHSPWSRSPPHTPAPHRPARRRQGGWRRGGLPRCLRSPPHSPHRRQVRWRQERQRPPYQMSRPRPRYRTLPAPVPSAAASGFADCSITLSSSPRSRCDLP